MEAASVRVGPSPVFVLFFPSRHISRVMGLKLMHSGIMEMCSLEENLRHISEGFRLSPVLDPKNVAFAFLNMSTRVTKDLTVLKFKG